MFRDHAVRWWAYRVAHRNARVGGAGDADRGVFRAMGAICHGTVASAGGVVLAGPMPRHMTGELVQ